MAVYKKDVIRPCSLFSVKAWYEEESRELKKWIGFGFFNHLFLCKDGMARLYYDAEEGMVFDKILDEKLNEELFDKLCDNLFAQIDNAKNAKTEEEIFEIIVKCWPSFTIFDVVSKYPEYASESMIRRLIRVRKETESFSYEIEERINAIDMPKDFIFFKGRVIEKQFADFIQENKITIKS